MSDTDIEDILDPEDGYEDERPKLTVHSAIPPMPPEIGAAISKVMGSVKKLQKTDRNQFAKYSYTSADAFFEALGPLMAEAGLITIAQQVAWRSRAVATDRERSRNILLIDYDFFLVHSSGAIWQYPLRRTINVDAGGPQVWGGATTYIEKQFLRQLLKVPTGDKLTDKNSEGGDADEQQDYQEMPRRRQRVPVPGYAPTPAAGVGAAMDTGTSPQNPSNQAEDSVSAFLAALTSQETMDGIDAVTAQFKAGPYKLLDRERQKFAVSAHRQFVEQFQRDHPPTAEVT